MLPKQGLLVALLLSSSLASGSATLQPVGGDELPELTSTVEQITQDGQFCWVGVEAPERGGSTLDQTLQQRARSCRWQRLNGAPRRWGMQAERDCGLEGMAAWL